MGEYGERTTVNQLNEINGDYMRRSEINRLSYMSRNSIDYLDQNYNQSPNNFDIRASYKSIVSQDSHQDPNVQFGQFNQHSNFDENAKAYAHLQTVIEMPDES